MILQLRLLTALCDGNNKKWQNFMRVQELSAQPCNVVDAVVTMLVSATRDTYTVEVLGFDEAQLLVTAFEFLIECVGRSWVSVSRRKFVHRQHLLSTQYGKLVVLARMLAP